MVKNWPANEGDEGLIPGLGRFSGEGNSYPLQYFCLGNSMDTGAWWAIVYGIAKDWTQQSDLHTHILNIIFCYKLILKEMDDKFVTEIVEKDKGFYIVKACLK